MSKFKRWNWYAAQSWQLKYWIKSIKDNLVCNARLGVDNLPRDANELMFTNFICVCVCVLSEWGARIKKLRDPLY